MNARYEGLEFERPGHATIRIETDDGVVVYVDPCNEVISGTPGDADVVFATHEHGDHYDPSGITAVSDDATIVAVFEGVDTTDLDTEVVHLSLGDEYRIGGISVQTVPAFNRPDGEHVRSSGEPYHPEGSAIGLVIVLDDARVYYCSDTDALEELTAIDADVVVPPIGGRPTMDRHEAAEFVKRIRPGLVIPVHYNSEVIDGLETDAEAFKADVEEADIRVALI